VLFTIWMSAAGINDAKVGAEGYVGPGERGWSAERHAQDSGLMPDRRENKNGRPVKRTPVVFVVRLARVRSDPIVRR